MIIFGIRVVGCPVLGGLYIKKWEALLMDKFWATLAHPSKGSAVVNNHLLPYLTVLLC